MKIYLATIVLICCSGNSSSFRVFPDSLPFWAWHAGSHALPSRSNVCPGNDCNRGHSATDTGFCHEIRASSGHPGLRSLFSSSTAYRTRDVHAGPFALTRMQRRYDRPNILCNPCRMAMMGSGNSLDALSAALDGGSGSSSVYGSKRTRRRRRAPPSENELWTKALESQSGPIEVLLDLDNAASALEHIEVLYVCMCTRAYVHVDPCFESCE
jgi:hypothetical protein